MEEFELGNNEFVELKNLLKLVNLCESGGIAMVVITEGRVKVDGQAELRKRCKIRKGQVVEFEGHEVVVK